MSPLVLQMLPMVSGKVHEVHQQVGGIFGEVFCHKHKRLILWLTCRNAYIVCAMRSSNFCSSAKHAFELLIKNLVRVVVLNKGRRPAYDGFILKIHKRHGSLFLNLRQGRIYIMIKDF